MTNNITSFVWRDSDSDRRHGEGISRPHSSSQVKEYRLTVKPKGEARVNWITKAESLEHAIEYASARWPGSLIESK